MVKPKKRVQPKQAANSKKVLCENCGMYFSKKSNLNTHIQKVHKGLRWKCHICGERQVSKHSHIRHYQSKHPNQLPDNINVNQRYASSSIDMPSSAKDEIIEGLQKKVEVQEKLLKSFHNRLTDKLEEIIHLKCRLGINCEDEKVEYNTLLETGKASDGSVCTGSKGNSNDDESDDDNDSPPVQTHSVEETPDADKSASVHLTCGGEWSSDDDDTLTKSSYYPDKDPLRLSPISNDPEAGGSSM